MYALVSYIPGPLGDFLNRLRADLVPSCRLLSHLTLLPPRLLAAPTEQLEGALEQKLPAIPPFSVTLGEVRLFEETRVVYLNLETGEQRAREIHTGLSDGVLDFAERFAYHPHVTLAQEFSADRFAAIVQEAQSRWASWTGPRTFEVEELVFVRNRDVNTWDSIAEYRLGRNGRPFQAIRTVESAAPLLP